MAEYHYTAFISYRHQSPDQEIAKKLHTMIETFPIPSSLKQSLGRKTMGRVFRDQEELPLSKDLGADIRNALDHSDWLIVIASPKYLESRWCLAELEYFISLGRRDRILTVLAEGEPEDSFPELLRYEIVEGKRVEVEPLAADVRAADVASSLVKLKQERLRVLAPMLGVNFDDLRQRARQRRNRMLAFAMLGVILLLSGFLGYSLKKNNQISAERNGALTAESKWLAQSAVEALESGNKNLALLLALEAMPEDPAEPDRPIVAEAVAALYSALAGGVADEYDSPYEIETELEGDILSDRSSITVYADGGKRFAVYDILTGSKAADQKKPHFLPFTAEAEPYCSLEQDVDDVAQMMQYETVEGNWDYKTYTLLLDDRVMSMSSDEDRTNYLYVYFSGAEGGILHTYRTTEPHNREYFNYHGGESMVDRVRNFGSSYDGRVVYAQEGRYIYFWDTASEEVLTVLSYLDFDKYYFYDSQISHDGPFIVFHTAGGSGYVYNYMTGETIRLDSGTDSVDSVQLNRDSNRVLCLSRAGNCANIYLTATGDKVTTLTADFTIEKAVYPSVDSWRSVTDDSYIALAGEKKLKVFTRGTEGSNTVIAQVNDIVAHQGEYPILFSEDGSTLWTVDRRDGYSVAAVDSASGEVLREIESNVFLLEHLERLPDHRLINYGQWYYGNEADEEHRDHALARIIDTQSLEVVREICPVQVFEEGGETKTLEKFTLFDMDCDEGRGRILLTGNYSSKKDYGVFVYDLESGEELWQLNQREYLKVLAEEYGALAIHFIDADYSEDRSRIYLTIQYEDDSYHYYPRIFEIRDAETFDRIDSIYFQDRETFENSEAYGLLPVEEKTYRFGGSVVFLENGRLLDGEGNMLMDFGRDMTLLDSSPDGSQLAVTYYESEEYNETGKILIIHHVDEQTLLNAAREILNGKELTEEQKKKYFLE